MTVFAVLDAGDKPSVVFFGIREELLVFLKAPASRFGRVGLHTSASDH